MNTKSKFGYLWVTLALFLVSLIGHWAAGWFEYKKEQEEHQQPVETKDYVIEMTRGTLEHWQSEFLQLIWQVAGPLSLGCGLAAVQRRRRSQGS